MCVNYDGMLNGDGMGQNRIVYRARVTLAVSSLLLHHDLFVGALGWISLTHLSRIDVLIKSINIPPSSLQFTFLFVEKNHYSATRALS
jgi:hypothetical protein